MKTLKNILMIFSILCFSACVDDNSNTDFKELNEVTFADMPSKHSVLLYHNLTIPLQMTTTKDESKFAYVWYIYTPTSRGEADTLGKERNLDVLIDPSNATPGFDYTLVVKVTDQTTGVFYRKEMTLEVLTEFTKGTLLLCEENGQAEVNFIGMDDGRTLYENIYSRANGGNIVGKNPQRIFAVNPNNYAPDMKQVVIMCKDENGGMVASPVSIEAIKPLRNAFSSKIDDPVLSPELYFKGGMIDYIIMNGQVRKRAVNMAAMEWEAPLTSTEGAATYEMAPFAMEVGGVQTFYDRKHHRLLEHSSWNMGALHQLAQNESGVSKYSSNDFGDDMELLACGELSEVDNFWMLMKNTETGKLYIYKFKVSEVDEIYQFVGTAKVELTSQVAPNIYNALSFSANKLYPDVLMYATKDHVYSFAINQIGEGTTVSVEAQQANLAEINMEITGIRFVTVTVPSPTPEDPNRTREAQQLRVFVHDKNLTTRKGGIVYYEVSSEGGIHSAKIFTKTGFCDTVIDQDEKYN